jgi:hypothetical protein
VCQFNDDWTPAHLTRRPTNLYSEAAVTLKGLEWRKPGLVAVAAQLAARVGERQPIEFEVSEAYEPKAGPNRWTAEHGQGGPSTVPSAGASGHEMFRQVQPQKLPTPAASRSEGPEVESSTRVLGLLSV